MQQLFDLSTQLVRTAHFKRTESHSHLERIISDLDRYSESSSPTIKAYASYLQQQAYIQLGDIISSVGSELRFTQFTDELEGIAHTRDSEKRLQMYLLGIKSFNSQEYSHAINFLQYGLRTNELGKREKAHSYFLIGLSELKEENLVEAVSAFSFAINQLELTQNERLEAYTHCAHSLVKHAIIQIEHENTLPFEGIIGENKPLFERAMHFAKLIKEYDPNDQHAAYIIGKSSLELGKLHAASRMYEKACSYFKESISELKKWNKTNPTHRLELAQAHQYYGHLDDMLAKKSWKLGDFGVSISYAAEGFYHYVKAIELYQSIIHKPEVKMERAFIYSMMADCYSRNAIDYQAERYFSIALDLFNAPASNKRSLSDFKAAIIAEEGLRYSRSTEGITGSVLRSNRLGDRFVDMLLQ